MPEPNAGRDEHHQQEGFFADLDGTVADGLDEAGPRVESGREPFPQRSGHLGLRVDVTDVADALEWLEGPTAR